MKKRNSLERYALFYEKIDKPARSESSSNNEYDKTIPRLSEDQVSRLGEDLQSPVKASSASKPIR